MRQWCVVFVFRCIHGDCIHGNCIHPIHQEERSGYSKRLLVKVGEKRPNTLQKCSCFSECNCSARVRRSSKVVGKERGRLYICMSGVDRNMSSTDSVCTTTFIYRSDWHQLSANPRSSWAGTRRQGLALRPLQVDSFFPISQPHHFMSHTILKVLQIT